MTRTEGPAPVFGWTGIKSERYTRWHGKLDDRRTIVRRMVTESFKFNVKTPAVIIVIVLGWLFSMLFPVLMAASGVLSLEADSPNTWDGTQAVQVGMHRMISNDYIAEYSLTGSTFTNRTEFATINVPMGWAAFVNATTEGEKTGATLVVIPPAGAPPMATAAIQVRATTGRRVDYFTTVTSIAPMPELANITRSYELDFDNSVFEGAAGQRVDVAFHLTNTGTVNDTYNITINTIPDDWKLSVYINGTKTPLKSRQVRFQAMEGPPGFRQTVTIRYLQTGLAPGEDIPCRVAYETAPDSAKSNAISITVNSRTDQVVTGSYFTQLKLSDTKKMDLTGTILFNQVMSLQPFFALLLAAVVGSRMIATDLQEKSYNLYFARPLSKKDYIAGKFGILGSILTLVTIVPSLITYALLILLSKISDTYVVDHLWAWGAIVGYGLVVVITLTTLALAFSSLTSRRFYAAAALVVIYLVTTIMGQIAAQAFKSDFAQLIGVADNFSLVGNAAFGLLDKLNLKFDWHYSLVVLSVIWALCTFLVWFKIERTELSE